MGTLGGHVLPGTFFIIFGIWWSFITSMRYIIANKKSKITNKTIIGYRGSVTMPCIILPCAKLRQFPLESWFKLIAGTIGLLGEVITGFHFETHPVYDKIFDKITNTNIDNGHDMHMDKDMGMHHHHKRDAPLPTIPVKTLRFAYNNTQHITMYFAFILGSIVEILLYHKWHLPKKLPYALGIFAFGIEGFLFANHLHSRHMLDIHLHTLLTYAIYGCVFFAFLETYRPEEVIFSYGKVLFTILQGTWFWQVGFVLYPPSNTPAFQWDHDSHNHVMLITGSFCWHAFFIIIGLIMQLSVMQCLYRSSYKIRTYFDSLTEIDELNNMYDPHDEFGDNGNSNDIKITGHKNTYFSLVSDDDEDIQFDTAKLLPKSNDREQRIQLEDIKYKKVDNEIHSSSSSGNHSASLI